MRGRDSNRWLTPRVFRSLAVGRQTLRGANRIQGDRALLPSDRRLVSVLRRERDSELRTRESRSSSLGRHHLGTPYRPRRNTQQGVMWI